MAHTRKFNGTPAEIMLVEDNKGDILLTIEAFQEAKIHNNIHVAQDGVVAMQMLRKQPPYEAAVTPDLILLDLNLPRKDGREVLEEIKNDNELKRIPVVIMTSSKAERDIVESYNLHASSYVVKPIDLEKFCDVVRAIENFWFTVVVLPD